MSNSSKITAIMLYEQTGDESIVSFAEKVYEFWWQNMVDKTTYQVADHFDNKGDITWWKFTYNEVYKC